MVVKELQRLFGLSGHRLVIPNGDPNEMRFEQINPTNKSKKQDRPDWVQDMEIRIQ